MMPMRYKGLVYRGILVCQNLREISGPRWLAFACVDKYAPRPLTDQIRICSCSTGLDMIIFPTLIEEPTL
jgi:hypothetical protein